ncbi:MAG: histidinol-phosphatase [Treponema sp.]|nr:histidinol-phosphatase [Treponema sp.]
MKGYTSLHVHTRFCDGADDMETMCRAAFDAGLEAIGFSSHAPAGDLLPDTRWNMKRESLERYVAEGRAAGERWKGKLRVFLGLELDYARGLRGSGDADIVELRASGALDYLIGSVHYIAPERGELFTIDGSREKMLEKMRAAGLSPREVAEAYWDAVREMAALGGIDVVGHMDLIKMHFGDEPFSAEWEGKAADAVRAIAGAGLVVEASTGGINRGRLRELCPSPAILRLLKEAGARVMVSADAHRAADVAGNYGLAREALLAAGYESHAVMAGAREGSPLWREIPL